MIESMIMTYRRQVACMGNIRNRTTLVVDQQIPLYSRRRSIYRVSQEECARLREGVPYVKVYRYNLKHLCPKLNGYGDKGKRRVWASCGSTHCNCQLTNLSISVLECGVILLQVSSL